MEIAGVGRAKKSSQQSKAATSNPLLRQIGQRLTDNRRHKQYLVDSGSTRVSVRVFGSDEALGFLQQRPNFIVSRLGKIVVP